MNFVRQGTRGIGEPLSGKCCGQQVAVLCFDSSGAALMKSFEGDADGMR